MRNIEDRKDKSIVDSFLERIWGKESDRSRYETHILF